MFVRRPRGSNYHRRQHAIMRTVTLVGIVLVLAAAAARLYALAVVLGLLPLSFSFGWTHRHDYKRMDEELERHERGER